MQLYDLPKELRQRCEIDVQTIGGKPTSNLDLYLYHFPLQKKLAYAYLKASKQSVKLSELHELFKYFDQADFFLGAEHKDLLRIDSIYRKVTLKYVRNRHTWTTSLQPIQSYLFDAKHLKIGQYQAVAKRCMNDYFSGQFMHYTMSYNKLKVLNHLDENNNWWIERRAVEEKFFNEILTYVRFNTRLRFKWYNRFIEFYDDVSTLTLQFELTKYEVKMRIIWPRGFRKRSRSSSQDNIMKFLQRYSELFVFYQKLVESRDKVLKYYIELDSINKKYEKTYNVLVESMVQFLQDFHTKDESTYIESEAIHGYMVHHGSVERVGIVSRKGRLRIYRNVKNLKDPLNRVEELAYSSYRLPEKDFEDQAKELLNMGLISIGDRAHPQVMYDYELLANGNSTSFALQFFKLTSTDAMQFFADYESKLPQLTEEINYLQEENMEIEDTRQHVDIKEDYVSTYFEWLRLSQNPDEFNDTRDFKLNQKRKRIRTFLENNTKLLKQFSDESTKS